MDRQSKFPRTSPADVPKVHRASDAARELPEAEVGELSPGDAHHALLQQRGLLEGAALRGVEAAGREARRGRGGAASGEEEHGAHGDGWDGEVWNFGVRQA